MCDWEACTTATTGLPNRGQSSVAKFLHPYKYRYAARAFLWERILALEGEGITWMGQPSRQGIALFSVRTEFWRSTDEGLARFSRIPQEFSLQYSKNPMVTWRGASAYSFRKPAELPTFS